MSRSFFPRRIAAATGGAFALTLSTLAVPAALPTASAADPAPGCVDNGTTVTCTFAYTGGPQTWTVPDGVTSATFDLWGAAGGSVAGAIGGKGAHVRSTISVTPGATLTIRVGGSGDIGAGGYNGGGGGYAGGGGGGATDVRSGGDGLVDRILVAGGGGGVGDGHASPECTGPTNQVSCQAVGGDGGASGAKGERGSQSVGPEAVFGGDGGDPGTDAAGGEGGESGGAIFGLPDPGAGKPGTLGQGGDAGFHVVVVGGVVTVGPNTGGGGGGGWYGGGGGGTGDAQLTCYPNGSPTPCEFGGGGGGGGGSSHAPGGTVEDGVREGSGLAQVTYTKPTADTTKPTVTINQAAAQADPTSATPIRFTAVFSESVTGFDASDVVLSGTAPGKSVSGVTGSGTTYTVSVAATGSGTVIATIPANSAQDAASNSNEASTSTDNTVTYDTVAPTVTVNQTAAQADPTNYHLMLFNVDFSERVAPLVPGDIELSGTAPATVAQVTPWDTDSFRVSVAASGPGTVTVTVPAGVTEDLAGNPNTASTSTDNTVTYDNGQPSVTIDQSAGQADPTNGTIQFRAVFSKSVTGFVKDDVELSGTAPGADVASVTGSGTTYTVTVSGMTGPGTVIATIPADVAQDAAGNTNAASTSTDNEVTFDNVGPSVTIDQAPGQTDPTSTPTVEFRVVFDESVTGFDAADVSLAGSTAPGASVSSVTGSGTTYTVTVDGMTGSGDVVASVRAAAVADPLGNPSSASTSTDNRVTYQAPPPPPKDQRIRFTSTPPSPARPGDTYTPTATGGGSGNPVVITVAPESSGVCTIDAQGVVRFTGEGTCVLRANQAGGNGYAPAPPVDHTVTVVAGPAQVTDPRITATLTSATHKLRGWYRTPVTVTFTCTPGTGTLTCPVPVTLRRNGADQSVTRTVTASDGGTATVTVPGIDIDRKEPKVRARGVRKGATYNSVRTVRCRATDQHSGIHRCKVVTRGPNANGKVRYRLVAVDVAGNRSVLRGWYRLR